MFCARTGQKGRPHICRTYFYFCSRLSLQSWCGVWSAGWIVFCSIVQVTCLSPRKCQGSFGGCEPWKCTDPVQTFCPVAWVPVHFHVGGQLSETLGGRFSTGSRRKAPKKRGQIPAAALVSWEDNSKLLQFPRQSRGTCHSNL